MGLDNARKRKRFKGVCDSCNKDIYVCKSIGIEIGWLDKGIGQCIHCETYLELKFNDDDETVVSTVMK